MGCGKRESLAKTLSLLVLQNVYFETEISFSQTCYVCFTTKQDPAKPTTELVFPSVTVCAPGLNMEAVEEALFQDFERWKREKPYESDETHKEDIDTFMETEYAMKVGKGNIFDTIKALVLPPTNRDSPSSSLALENLATCREYRSPKTNRTKRATAAGNINCSRERVPLFCMFR